MPSDIGYARIVLWCSLLLCLALSRSATPEPITAARLLFPPPMDLPAYLTPTVDSSIGTTLVRVTTPDKALGNGLACTRYYCTHRYSSAQAWNADQSLLVIGNGCNGLCF